MASKQKITVSFESRYEESIPWENKDNISPYIHIKSPESDIAGQRNPDEIVIPMKEIQIVYEYPLEDEVLKSFPSDKPEGFTRAHLARVISQGYHQIYDEEERAVGNPGHIPGMLNRAKSTGPYGIWGHDLEDLDLHGVEQREGNIFDLHVDS